MSVKIKTIIEIEDGSTQIKEKYEVAEYELAKELFPPMINKCMRMMAEGSRQIAGKQQEINFETYQKENTEIILQKERCLNCQFVSVDGCKLRGELPDQEADASCIYFLESFVESHEDVEKLTDMLKAQIIEKEKLMEKSKFEIAKESYVKTVKARECFYGGLNEEFRGLQEAVGLTFDTEVQLYLYDENFFRDTLLPLKDAEVSRHIETLISEQNRVIIDLQSKIIGLKKTLEAEKPKQLEEGIIKKEQPEETINPELKPEKKRNSKKEKTQGEVAR